MPVLPFQKLSVVRLMTAKKPAPDSPEDANIQTAHINYLQALVREGTILANGPVRRIDDPDLRGMSLYLVDVDEARRIANDDPAVKAGWFDIHVDEWLIPVNPRTIADRHDIEIDVPV